MIKGYNIRLSIILFDFQKVFENVDYVFLCKKKNKIKKDWYKKSEWFELYLLNRK